LVAGAIIVGAVVRDTYYLSVITFIAIHSLIAVGLCLLMGLAGQISLGHAAFYGMGAYTSGILSTRAGWNPWLALPVAIAITCVTAYLIGVPTLRLKGHYLAMATLGFGMIVHIVMKEFSSITGGNSGLTGIPPLALGGVVLDGEQQFYWVAAAAVVGVLLFSSNVAHSRAGRALRAVHGSESAAAVSGVDIAGYKVKVFVLSACFAALAGFLYAHYVGFISPQPFDFKFSVELVVMVVLGGAESVWGGLLGAALITLLGEVLRQLGDYDVIVFGTILMAVVVFMPTGIAGPLSRLRRVWPMRTAPAERSR
jgi:branched-chain amino acid transport system permease protein